jgi:hypothetical protein
MLYKVENDTLVRDSNTSAILETDNSKLLQYRMLRRQKQEKEQTVEQLVDRINKLETLIETLIERINYGDINT